MIIIGGKWKTQQHHEVQKGLIDCPPGVICGNVRGSRDAGVSNFIIIIVNIRHRIIKIIITSNNLQLKGEQKEPLWEPLVKIQLISYFTLCYTVFNCPLLKVEK